mmetsp:Transcript_21042/g.59191  ORF Transcript_21042/g.59191 Transcript_21042/m.59191 type:complete len:178 (+) Transcript_21042:80-613(+)
MDCSTKERVGKIGFLQTRAGPRDGDAWVKRLKEEYKALIQYIKLNKDTDNDWFTLSSNKAGTRWQGKCWTFIDNQKYEFDFEFDIPVTYPTTAPEIQIPELDGKTPKMYRGGKICLTVHFKPLWSKNVPHFGIAHALCMGLAPWLGAEIPLLADRGLVTAGSSKDSSSAKDEGTSTS